ncbi:MAG: response regulator [Rubrivivax sp.]|nr:response regulator [Rubrivivax sp.]
MTQAVRILIVDDDAVVRQAFTRVLSGEHTEVQSAASGAEALQRLQEGAFDLVLLDLRMPGMDGISLLRTLKREWPDIEVIIVTGYAAVQTVKESIALGAFDYLAKPVGPQDVISATRSALAHKGWALRREPAAAACAVA